MLVGGRQAVWWVPVMPMLLALVFAPLSILPCLAAFPHRARDHSAPWLVGMELVLAAYALFGVRRFETRGEELRLRGPLLRVDLTRHAGAGYRMRPGGRGGSLVVYFTDGLTRHDVISLVPWIGATRRAERLIAELTRRLSLQPSEAARRTATADLETMQAAQRTVDAYYQSREWKRANVIVLVVVVLYIALVILFAHATGRAL